MLGSLFAHFKRIGLQQRIMLYVTSGLFVFSTVYGLMALQAIQQSTDLVYQERLFVARTLAEEMDDRWASVGDAGRAQLGAWLDSALDVTAGNYAIEVLDPSGAVIASKPQVPRSYSKAHLDLILPLWQAHESGWRIHTLQINGQTTGHVIAFAPLGHIGWGVIVEQPIDEAFSLPRTLQSQFAIFGVLAVGAGLVLAYVTTQPVVRPVRGLIHASQAIAQGNLDHPLDVSGEGEIGTLARTFDEMRVNLKQSREEIAHWNRQLETRVDIRTRELAALVSSSHALTSTLELDALFAILMDETRAVLPLTEGIALLLFEPESQALMVRASFGLNADECRQVRFQSGEAIAGRVFDSQKPMLLRSTQEVRTHQANFSASNRLHFRRATGDRSVLSALGMPLIVKGARLGALMLYSFSRERAFDEGDVPLLQALADQAAAAIENARLYAELQQKEAVRTQLLEKVIEAQEEERKRIARDLHDEFAQTLTALTINLQGVMQSLPPEMSALKQQLAEAHNLTAQTLTETGQWILELRPAALDDLGLVPAIRWYAQNRLESEGTQVVVEASGLKRRLPTGLETALFRIAQEAVSNIAKHAHAQHVHIRLTGGGGHIGVAVEDDGRGFDADEAFSLRDSMRGLGLLGMRERASLLGGTLGVHSQAGHGTCVQVEVPWTD